MDSVNMTKALDIYSRLITGEDISRSDKKNGYLYEEYYQNAEVYELVSEILKRLNLNIYEYNESLYLTAGEGNRVFGYSNDELKRLIGLRYNKELYLCYYIMYNVLLSFYKDSASYQFKEYVKLEDIIEETSKSLDVILKDLSVYAMEDIEEQSFKAIALLWDELPMVTGEDNDMVRASRGSKSGITKLTFNFLVSQKLFIELEERYYPTDRMKALVENYFEEYRGQIYTLLEGGKADA